MVTKVDTKCEVRMQNRRNVSFSCYL